MSFTCPLFVCMHGSNTRLPKVMVSMDSLAHYFRFCNRHDVHSISLTYARTHTSTSTLSEAISHSRLFFAGMSYTKHKISGRWGFSSRHSDECKRIKTYSLTHAAPRNVRKPVFYTTSLKPPRAQIFAAQCLHANIFGEEEEVRMGLSSHKGRAKQDVTTRNRKR